MNPLNFNSEALQTEEGFYYKKSSTALNNAFVKTQHLDSEFFGIQKEKAKYSTKKNRRKRNFDLGFLNDSEYSGEESKECLVLNSKVVGMRHINVPKKDGIHHNDW